MSHSRYSQILLHLTWHTKSSMPLLSSDVGVFFHRWVKHRLAETQGVLLHEVGGTETHVHLAVTIEPTLVIADLIGQLKGASSHAVNQHFRLQGKQLQWQTGYGVVSFGAAHLDWVTAYIRNQEAHHRRGSTHDRLERFDDKDAAERVQ